LAIDQDLTLIHDSKLPCSFNSGRWHKGYNPDLVFVTDRISAMCVKEIGSLIPNSQHRPIILKILGAIRPATVQFKRCFNFKRADWDSFSTKIDAGVARIDPAPEKYNEFLDIFRTISRETIPKGCRSNYIPGLLQSNKKKLSRYIDMYSTAQTPSLRRHFAWGGLALGGHQQQKERMTQSDGDHRYEAQQ